VSVREGTRAIGLTGDAHRVTGAVVDTGGRVETVPADIVVDATGRHSSAVRWLAGLGAAPVAEDTVDAGLAYSTRVYRAPAGIADAIPAIMVHPRPVDGRPGLGLTLFPIEDGRWIVTLTGTRDTPPPVDERRFTSRAGELGAPLVGDLIAAAQPLGTVRPYRATANRRRYFERGPRPLGFLVVGDAAIAVNPVYSHGMSIAAMTALRLSTDLDRVDAEASLQRSIAAVGEPSWRMATAGDRGLVRGAADAGPASAMAHRLSAALPADRALMTTMFRTQALMSPTDPQPPASPADTLMPPSAAQDIVPLSAAEDIVPLSAAGAVAQYPGLSSWWRSRTVSATV
jgi:2-polyprenyl-6-methoxyphenol hydroxylase-like FAD-dependent oxidoreductase